MGFTRQEYWSGWPVPSPGDLPDPGIKPASPALAGGFFTSEPPKKSLMVGGGAVVVSIGMSSATQWATEANSQRPFSSSRALSAIRKHSWRAAKSAGIQDLWICTPALTDLEKRQVLLSTSGSQTKLKVIPFYMYISLFNNLQSTFKHWWMWFHPYHTQCSSNTLMTNSVWVNLRDWVNFLLSNNW